MSLEEVGGLGADWMIELLGIPVSATRRKCALLNLKVVARRCHRRSRLARLSVTIQFLLQSTGFSAQPQRGARWQRRTAPGSPSQPDRRGRAGSAARPPGHLARGRDGALEDQG